MRILRIKRDVNNVLILLIIFACSFFFGGWPFFRLVLAFFYLFLIPGYILIKILFPRTKLSVFETLPLSYCLGFSFLVIPGTIAFFIRPNLNGFALFYVLLILLLVILFLRYKNKIETKAEIDNSRNEDSSNVFLRIFVILIILGSVIVAWRMGNTYRGDALGHIGMIQHFFYDGVNPQDYITGDGIRVIYGFSAWHLSLALLFKISFLSPSIGWFYLAAIMTALSLLAFYSFVKSVIQSEEAASVALIVFLLLKLGGEGTERFLTLKIGWLTLGQWRTLSYPFAHTLYVFIPMVLFLFLNFYHKREKSFIFATGLLVLAIPAIHPLGLFSLYWAILCFAVFSWIFIGKKEILALKKMIWGFVIIPLPYILIKAIVYVQYRFSLKTSLIEAVSTQVNKDLIPGLEKVLGPFVYLNLNDLFSYPKIAFCTGVSLIFLLFFLKTRRGAQFLFSNTLFTTATGLVSITSTILMGMISLNLYIRITTRWLYFIGAVSLGWFFYEIFVLFRRWVTRKISVSQEFENILSQVLVFSLVILLILGVVFLNLFSFVGISSDQAQDILVTSVNFKSRPDPLTDDLSEFILANIPRKSLFLIDTENNRMMQRKIGLTGNHTFSDVARLGSAFLKIPAEERIRIVNQMLLPETGDNKVISSFEEYTIDYILVRKTKETTILRFEKINELTKIFENSSFILYKFENAG
jgi:hypothetical protein